MGREQMMLARLLQEEEREKESGRVEGAIVQQHSHAELKAMFPFNGATSSLLLL